MHPHDIIVIGASAGGVDALRRLVAQFPDDFPASIFVVRHISATAQSLLPGILERAGRLEARHALDGEAFARSRIYIAPPDHHMMIEDGCVRLTKGPKENLTRPAVDALFRSAALALRTRVVGVVLSGTLDDGTAGLWSIKYCGGVTVVQDPNEAEYPGMPQSAIDNVRIDHCVQVGEMGSLLLSLARDPGQETKLDSVLTELEIENRIAFGEFDALDSIPKLGSVATFSCPDCHSLLWEVGDDGFLRFRCATGHGFTPASLLAEQYEMTENVLSNAVRALKENVRLSEYLRDRARRRDQSISEDGFGGNTVERYRARLIQRILLNHDEPIKTTQPNANSTHPNGRNKPASLAQS